ncbi:hypothetical protein OsJ_18266 [Oryza sativa Japonica Group]|uniref:Uncharacterized protein n=1 Tax=Oryza sativa subsp. japonica TaxID=39947 RepID=B9FHH5_ORYSJ|nr:hypothetical protein OsJ_18266 [Oryza sativa Japonica Group]
MAMKESTERCRDIVRPSPNLQCRWHANSVKTESDKEFSNMLIRGVNCQLLSRKLEGSLSTKARRLTCISLKV